MTVYLLIVRERHTGVSVDTYAERGDAVGMARDIAESYPAEGRAPYPLSKRIVYHEQLTEEGEWVCVEACEVTE